MDRLTKAKHTTSDDLNILQTKNNWHTTIAHMPRRHECLLTFMHEIVLCFLWLFPRNYAHSGPTYARSWERTLLI